MFKRYLISLLLIITATANAQKLKVICPTPDTISGVLLIPDSIFSMQADRLYLPLPLTIKGKKNKDGFEIRWPSHYIDGSLMLTVTKKQIYLSSTHENPNPDYCYWLTNITAQQYKIIADKLSKKQSLPEKTPSAYSLFNQLSYKKYKPELALPDSWTNEISEKHYQDWLTKCYQNTADLIAFFNKGSAVENRIHFISKEDFDKIKAIQIMRSADDERGVEEFVPVSTEGKQ